MKHFIMILLLTGVSHLSFGAEPVKKETAQKDSVKTEPAKKESLPVKNPQTEITCKGKLDMDYEKNIAIFHDTVVVEDPRMHMEADEMTAFFKSESRTIEKVVAVGNVRFKIEEKSAKAEKAVYTAKDGKIVLTGNPMVKKGQDVMTGDTITFFRGDNRMLIEPRAKMIFYSSDKKDLEKDWL